MKAKEKLIDLQSAPLRYKMILTQERIREAVEKYGVDKCYVSFSGGKDSTVLLHIARQIYPSMKAVFFDTGLEYPEIRNFVKSFDNVDWLKPSMSFRDVITKHGIPVISKSISMAISRLRGALKRGDKVQANLRLNGGINPTSGRKQTCGVIPKKWHDLAINGDFKVSESCCDALKKRPAKAYHKKNGGIPLIGTMAADSMNRRLDWQANGCNAFDKKIPQSRPLMLWTSADVWQYIKENNLEYSKIYDMGSQNTGCIFCLFGIMKDQDRFVRLAKTHPAQHRFCIEKLGYEKVLNALGIPTGLTLLTY